MENRSTTGLLIGLILMTVLAAVFGYLYYQERIITNRQEQDLETRVTELATTEIKLDSISRQLDNRIAEVEGLGGDIAELQKMKEQLEADRASLRRGSASMNQKIKEYEAFLTKKDQELAQLREENQQLLSQKDSLVTQTVTLTRERQVLSDSLLGVVDKNRELEEKVTMASALRARNVKVYAVSSKGKVREGENVRARRVDKVRVDFLLEKNPLTEQAPKTIYMRILNPQGAILSDAATGSGVFQYNGRDETFTASKQINYTNNNQDVSFTYNRSSSFAAGTYAVELYSEGFKIGEGSFSVR
jgi:myosin heavy subunit